jgi:hypothetical protein
MSEWPTPTFNVNNIIELVLAVGQVLDDMRQTGTTCCNAAKADLRVAFEPFRLANPEQFNCDGIYMDLQEAIRIKNECDK